MINSNKRSSSTINNIGGTGTTNTVYAGYIRLLTNKNPDLKCTFSSDLFTVPQSNKGNKALTYPIGLITADEAAYAGLGYGIGNNRSSYLHSNQNYWTMTPFILSNEWVLSSNYFIDTNGLNNYRVENVIGIRPVINLRADVTLSGAGTTGNPYTVSS